MLRDHLKMICDALEAHPPFCDAWSLACLKQWCKEWAMKLREETFDEDMIPYIDLLVYQRPQSYPL